MVGMEVSKTLICSSCRKKGNTASEVCIILITGNQEKIYKFCSDRVYCMMLKNETCSKKVEHSYLSKKNY